MFAAADLNFTRWRGKCRHGIFPSLAGCSSIGTDMHEYSEKFYSYIGSGSHSSASVVVPLVKSIVPVETVLDAGGGNGVWARVWQDNGATATLVDGDYVKAPLVEDFQPRDLSRPFDLCRRFDLVQSLEVAEHLPAASAADFVASLVRHGDVVLFSAAAPGQGGEHHVNEQPPDYWRALFADKGFECFDFLRARLCNRRDVRPWYRYNTLIYANQAGQRRLAPEALRSKVGRADEAGDFAWRFRKAIVGNLPRSAVDRIAILMARMS
jgi:hypothetical protein